MKVPPRLKLWLLFVSVLVAIFLGKTGSRIIHDRKTNDVVSLFLPSPDQSLEKVNDYKWKLLDKENHLKGYFYLGEGVGYNGYVRLMMHVDPEGLIRSVTVMDHKETPSFYQKLIRNNFFAQFEDVPMEAFRQDSSLWQTVSGATITSNAVLQAAGNVYLAEKSSSPKRKMSIPAFSFSSLLVIFLFLNATLLKYIKQRTFQKIALSCGMLLSVIFLGFFYNIPLTLSRIILLLSGVMPDLHYQLPIFLIIIFSSLSIVILRQNTYCHLVCPFGCVQDLLGKVGASRNYRPRWYIAWKRVLWVAILFMVVLSLLFNDPALFQYEVFGAFFNLTAAPSIFVLLFLVILLSLFIKRPWCNFLCPVQGVFSFLGLLPGLFMKKRTNF